MSADNKTFIHEQGKNIQLWVTLAFSLNEPFIHTGRKHGFCGVKVLVIENNWMRDIRDLTMY